MGLAANVYLLAIVLLAGSSVRDYVSADEHDHRVG